jgi:uncharacterized integral membrane protein
MTVPGQKQPTDTPNLWVVPLLTLVVLLVPTLILVFSNTKSTTLNFAGLDWSAPLWLILLATFAAGIILGRLFGWIWGVFRRRRAKVKAAVGGAAGAAR